MSKKFQDFTTYFAFAELNNEEEKICEFIERFFPIYIEKGLCGDLRITNEYLSLIGVMLGNDD